MPFDIAKPGLRVRVRLTPRAASDRLGGVAQDENGVAWLQAGVTAPPEDGRANKALIRLLAKQWRLPRTAIEIIIGATDRRKQLSISNDAPADLHARLSGWLDAHTKRT